MTDFAFHLDALIWVAAFGGWAGTLLWTNRCCRKCFGCGFMSRSVRRTHLFCVAACLSCAVFLAVTHDRANRSAPIPSGAPRPPPR